MEYQHIAVVLPGMIASLAYAAFCTFLVGLRIKERGKSDLDMYHGFGLCCREDGERFSCGILQAWGRDDCTGRSLGQEVMDGRGAQSRRQKKYLGLIGQYSSWFH